MNEEYVTVFLSDNIKVTARPDDIIFFDPTNGIFDPTCSVYKFRINIMQVLMIREAKEEEISHYKYHGF